MNAFILILAILGILCLFAIFYGMIKSVKDGELEKEKEDESIDKK